MLYCVVPLRAFYDYLLLFLVPSSRQSLMILVVTSWLQFWCWYYWPTAIGLWTMLFLFVPCLVELLLPQAKVFVQQRQAKKLTVHVES